MGHYKGRDNRKQREKRRRRFEKRLQERGSSQSITSLADWIQHCLKPAWEAAARTIAEWLEAFRQTVAADWSLISAAFAQLREKYGPHEPISLDELRLALGGDGADLGQVTFDAEGKFRSE